jgi:sucrose phosphorylase|tara:strand:- start:339 stop:2051 length:1713 start_codon:yes stop_codon:yes gene_type:complete
MGKSSDRKNLAKIRKKIAYLYPNKDTDKIILKLKSTMDYYRKNNIVRAKRKKYNSKISLTNKDVILITYGDTIRQEGEKPLKTLHKFLKKYVKKSISGVHILPFFYYSSDDGFSVIDYKKVNSKLGDWEDVVRICKDYRLMVDLVVNHISRESKWFKGFLKGDEKYKNYFINFDKRVDTSSVFRPRTNPLLTKFKTKNGTKYIWTTFSNDQIDLNYKNPDVLIDMIDILLFYVSKGVEIIRLDAIAYLWKELGTRCIHLKQTHKIVKLMRDVLNYVAPYTIIITETNVPPKENMSYFGNGYDESQLIYKFLLPPLVFDAFTRKDTSYLQKAYKIFWALNKNSLFFNFLASHDGIGILGARRMISPKDFNSLLATTKKHNGLISYKLAKNGKIAPYELNITYFDAINNPNKKIAIEKKVKRFMASQVIILLSKGIPGIYIHSLLGSRNYSRGVEKTGINREINRGKLHYKKIEQEIRDKNSIRHKVLASYLHLLNARKRISALDPYCKEKPVKSDKILLITERKYKGKKIIAIVNVSEDKITLPKYTKKFDLISKKQFNGQVEPYGAYCLQ